MPLPSSAQEMIPLADWARLKGVKYITAWKWFRRGTLPSASEQMPSGMILVARPKAEKTAEVETWIYARVNSADDDPDLSEQIRRCELYAHAKGWKITGTKVEIAPATTPNRPKLQQIVQRLTGQASSRLIILDPSRLSRLDFRIWSMLFDAMGCHLVVLDNTSNLSGALDDCIHAMRHILDRRWGVKRRALLLSEISDVIGET